MYQSTITKKALTQCIFLSVHLVFRTTVEENFAVFEMKLILCQFLKWYADLLSWTKLEFFSTDDILHDNPSFVSSLKMHRMMPVFLITLIVIDKPFLFLLIFWVAPKVYLLRALNVKDRAVTAQRCSWFWIDILDSQETLFILFNVFMSCSTLKALLQHTGVPWHTALELLLYRN